MHLTAPTPIYCIFECGLYTTYATRCRQVHTPLKTFKNTNYFYYGDITGNIPGGALLLALDKLLKDCKVIEKDKILVIGVESSKWIYGYCILNKV